MLQSAAKTAQILNARVKLVYAKHVLAEHPANAMIANAEHLAIANLMPLRKERLIISTKNNQ